VDWTTETTGDLLVFEAQAKDQNAAARLAVAADVWAMAEREILPRHQPDEWDVLRLEVWPDSGRTILFPARDPYEERTDKALAQVHWPSLQDTWDACESDDSIDDDAFDAIVVGAVDLIIRALKNSFDESGLRTRLRVDCYTYGEEHLGSFGKLVRDV